MLVATSKITAQGQISVPPEVRARLSATPGSQLVWDVDDTGRVVVSVRADSMKGVKPVRRRRVMRRIVDDEPVAYAPIWSRPGLETD